ncbi:MAG: tetratricopeptide repeat protein, partial [Dehalococcoidia bacterium]
LERVSGPAGGTGSDAGGAANHLTATERLGDGDVEPAPAASGASVPPLAPETRDPTPDTLSLLGRLVEKSLVLLEEGDSPRYRLLETLRQYGRERLQQHGEAEATRRRHTEYYLALAERAEPHLTGPQAPRWLERLELEHDNLRTALLQEEEAGQPEYSLRLTAALWRFWYVRGHLREGRRWCEAALIGSEGTAPRPRARALLAAGNLAWVQSDYETASRHGEAAQGLFRALEDSRGIALCLNLFGQIALGRGAAAAAVELWEESLALLEGLGDTWGAALSLNNLAAATTDLGQYDRAEGFCLRALPLWRQLDDKHGTAFTLRHLGRISQRRGDNVGALALFEQSLVAFQTLGDERGMAVVLNNLGDLITDLGQSEQARDLLQRSLVLRHQIGIQLGIAESLTALACMAAGRDRLEQAARLLSAADALCESLGAELSPSWQDAAEASLRTIRAGLGEERLLNAQRAGRIMSLEEAIADALDDPWQSAVDERRQWAVGSGQWDQGAAEEQVTAVIGQSGRPASETRHPTPDTRPPVPLTARELEVLRLVVVGHSNKLIGLELVMSVRTVERHVANLYEKLGVHSKGEVIAVARERRLVSRSPSG